MTAPTERQGNAAVLMWAGVYVSMFLCVLPCILCALRFNFFIVYRKTFNNLTGSCDSVG